MSGQASGPAAGRGERVVEARFLGRVSYAAALAMQTAARDALRRSAGNEQLLLLEHPPVYTLGRNATPGDVLATPEWLAARGIEVHATDRGGQVTFHGPGQLVGYPILDLNPDRRDIRRYVRDLQEVLIRALASFGVAAERGEGPDLVGVWVGAEKIASLGVHISRWITTHGFALNVATDLALFGGIVACGLPAVRMTSIERQFAARGERPAPPSLVEVARRVSEEFAGVFGRRVELVEGFAARGAA